MTKSYTIQEVMEKAIEKEIEAQELYARLSAAAANDAARGMLWELAGVEKKHEELLRRYLRGELGEGTLEAEQAVDYRIAEHFEQPAISPDMKLDEVLLLASNREKASHELYLGLAAEHAPGRVRELFEDLASQELEHKHRVEYLYNEVAFPQLDGG
jgi:rubrerythrin